MTAKMAMAAFVSRGSSRQVQSMGRPALFMFEFEFEFIEPLYTLPASAVKRPRSSPCLRPRRSSVSQLALLAMSVCLMRVKLALSQAY